MDYRECQPVCVGKCPQPHSTSYCEQDSGCGRGHEYICRRSVFGSRCERVQTLYHSGPQAPRVIKHYPSPGDWWCRQDSNLWPSVPQTDVLSPELRHHQSSCGNSSNCRGSFSARRLISASSSATILSMIASMSFNCRINSRGVCRGNIDLASLTSSQRPP